jgi:hypothetical protein
VEALHFSLVAVFPDAFPVGAEVVKEQGANELEDVAFAGVVTPDLASFSRLHDSLKEGTEDGRGDARPVKLRAGQERVAHIAIEIGEAESFGEQVAVDVGEGGEGFVEVCLTLFRRGIEDGKEVREARAQVGAVAGRAVDYVEAEGFAVEYAGVFGEKAEEHTDQESFELVAGVAAGFQGVVKAAHDFDGREVDGVLVLESVLLVAGDEGKGVNVVVEIG